MIKDHTRHIIKVSPKGQIVLRKELRREANIRPGGFVEARRQGKLVVLESLDLNKELEKVEKIAEMASKKIRKGRTSVDIIRDQRG